jgi:hypothetical protein
MFNDLQVLVLDDKDTAGMSSKLRTLFRGATITPVNSVNEAKRLIDLQYWDIVVLDLNMDMDESLLTEDRPSGGFKAYFYLRKQYEGASKKILPPLIVIYTGEDALHSTLKPFFTDKEEPGRPFSIIFKAQEKETSLLRDHLVNLEIDRFRNNFYWLHSAIEAKQYLDILKWEINDEAISKLSNVGMSSFVNGALPLRRVFPTLMGQVANKKREFVLQFLDVLKEQDWLLKLNYLFQKTQPCGKFVHGESSQWSECVEQLSILPNEVASLIYADMQIEPPIAGKESFKPTFINHVDNGHDISRSSEQLDVHYIKQMQLAIEQFKAKWSRWDKEEHEFIITNREGKQETKNVVTLVGAILEAVKEVCNSGKNVAAQIQVKDNIRRLYLNPSIPIRIARESALNSIRYNSSISKIIVRVFQDQQTNSLCLDIIDDGEGFDPKKVVWENAFSGWQRELQGWGHLEIYTKHGNSVWLIQEASLVQSEFPNYSTLEGYDFGTLVRLRFNYRHDWENDPT